MENKIRPSARLGGILERIEPSTIDSHRPSLFLSNRFMFDLRDFLMVLEHLNGNWSERVEWVEWVEWVIGWNYCIVRFWYVCTIHR